MKSYHDWKKQNVSQKQLKNSVDILAKVLSLRKREVNHHREAECKDTARGH